MSNNINKKVWLIGAGRMAVEYAKVLLAQKVSFEVIGRSKKSADIFMEKTGVKPHTGGIEAWIENSDELPTFAIVAISVEKLASTTILLLEKGIKHILVEKPGGLNLNVIKQVKEETKKRNAEVFVAYNRRFYSSTLKAQEIIALDGGVTSFNFEFTELSHIIKNSKKNNEVKKNWLFANSSHVIDLAFFLGGKPKEIKCFKSGGLDWHPSASVFAGSGLSEREALFTYKANWEAPGRWGVEFLTHKYRLTLRPLEELYIQEIGDFNVKKIQLDNNLDKDFKPGLYLQVKHFLCANATNLLSIDKHEELCRYYTLINSGN